AVHVLNRPSRLSGVREVHRSVDRSPFASRGSASTSLHPVAVLDEGSVDSALAGNRSTYATGSQTTPSTARVNANTRCAARLNASSRGVGAYWLKKKIHAACVL